MPSLKNQARIDPAPSRWSWRFQRLMLTPAFLFGLRIGVPFVVTLVIGAWCISNPETRAVIAKAVMQARESIEQRPEFMVNLMAIDGGDTDLSEAIRSSVSLNFPVSSFELVPSEVRDKLLKLDHHYCMSGYGAICAFAVNSIVSGLVVFNNMLDGKTGTVFLTNVLFMGSKLGNMYSIISTEKNIFYSAYLMRKVQYNDVDPDKYIEKVEEV